MKLCGIEEAGRGPVIGPMVMTGVMIENKDEHLLKKLGVADSKLLSAKRREELFDKILALVEYRVEILSPQTIDDALHDPLMNLNKLEAHTTVKIVSELEPDKVIIDCPSPDTKAYAKLIKTKLLEKIKKDIEIVAEHKADVNHPIVSAASIIAKVIRDREIEKIKKQYGIDFGSGYTSDEKTIEFLKKNYDKYDFFRKNWQTYKNAVAEKKQKKIFEF